MGLLVGRREHELGALHRAAGGGKLCAASRRRRTQTGAETFEVVFGVYLKSNLKLCERIEGDLIRCILNGFSPSIASSSV